MMKKIISLLLCLVLICFSFSGCADKAPEYELKYTYDSHYSLDDGSLEIYSALCKAAEAGESSVSIGETDYDAALRLFYISCPFSAFVSDMNVNSDGSLRISYKETQSNIAKKAEQFEEAVAAALYECGYPDEPAEEQLLNIYSYVSQNVSYNGELSTAYDAAVQKEGSSSAYEGMFRYLVQQAGFSASRVYGVAHDSTHFITQVELDGELYYFDPCAENSFSGGKGLSYFAMDTLGLQKMGLGEGTCYSDNEPISFDSSSGRFSKLYRTVSYEYKDGVITATTKSGEVVQVALK